MGIVPEEWRPLTGDFQGWPYEVSNCGRLVSTRHGRLMKCSVDIHGYLKVNLNFNCERRDARIHRLVALAFVDGFFPGLDVNHKNGIKTDNHADNLEWVTRKQNIHHAIRNGFGRKSYRRKMNLTRREAEIARRLMRTRRVSVEFLARWFGVSKKWMRSVRHRDLDSVKFSS